MIAAGFTAWIMRPKVNEAVKNATRNKHRSIFLSVWFWVILLITSIGSITYRVWSDAPLTTGAVLGLISTYVTGYVSLIALFIVGNVRDD